MKKNITNEELTVEIKKWIGSFTKDEWRKKLEEEKYLYEINKSKDFEWLSIDGNTIINDLPNVECVALTSEDERIFTTWTLSNIKSIDNKVSMPIAYEEVCVDLVEAA